MILVMMTGIRFAVPVELFPLFSLIRSSLTSFDSGCCFLDLLRRREGSISLTEGSKKLPQKTNKEDKRIKPKSTPSDE
jgi:hypothetical protein